MDKVAVLMSTYNGETYLEEQINSILKQKNIDVELIIRDDGSTDNTVAIIEEYMDIYDNITFFKGNNKGYANSFLSLLKIKNYKRNL